MSVWIFQCCSVCTNLMCQCHKCPKPKIILLYCFGRRWSTAMCPRTVSDAGNVMQVAYCFGMGPSSSPNDRLGAFWDPMYRLEEFGLILDLQKSPSYPMLCLFCKCWRCDKLLGEETVQTQCWLSPKYKSQKYQFSRCLQRLKSLCYRHEWLDMVWDSP